MIKNLKINSFLLIQLLIGLMFSLVLLPSVVKSIAIIFLLVFTMIFFFKSKNKFNSNLFLNNSLLFFLLFFTIIYSDNLSYGFNKLSTMLSLLVFPLIMSFFNQKDIDRFFKQIKKYLVLYVVAVSLFNIVPFSWYLITQDTLQEITKHYPYVIIIDFGKYSIHPIYISMHTAIAIIFSVYLFREYKAKISKFLLVLVICSLVTFLIIYLRKGPIIALIIVLIIWAFLKNKAYLKYNILFIVALIGLLVLIPKTRNRFIELLNVENAVETNQSSTNIRYTIYNNSFQLIKKEPLFGYGIGDYYDKLNDTYSKNAVFLFNNGYNSHNQYISFVLIGGFVLLLFVILMFYKNIRLSINSNNIILTLILVFYGVMMCFENILERENGVIFFSFFLNFFGLKSYSKKEKSVLIVGPFPKPISGVSLANKVVKEVLDNSNDFIVDSINTSYVVFEDAVGSFSFKKFFFFLKINLGVFKVFKNDIIYITPGQTFFGITKYALFILFSSILNKELIIHVHGNYLGTQYKELSGIKKRVFYYLISKFTKGIVLSASLKPNLTPFLKEENIYVLFNFAQNYLLEKEEVIDCSILKISYLSNLMEEKGIFLLLESLKDLENKKINYQARIAGNIDANLKEGILKKISKLKNTTYVGVVYNDDKKALLNWSNVFVLPTFYKMEGQPISILEALATSNVIISTNHAGISDIIEDKKNGYLIEPKNTDKLIEVFTFLDKNKSIIEEISRYNKTYFINNFTADIFQFEFLKIINDNTKT
ncbi:glycosyltransferase [Polaribacter sargassicola]|uniref:glycosyltransferase n=1 Tax=Polaribacter sargassicola TaxID=2836891 RepID=UPI001F3250F5|nr:glycosyltransferase [Polaribacter sp. DS7-9]MCG1035340.1 glycosyltransferase [Polaribacter sp. DS7-9]